MYPAIFDYYRASTAEEAISLLGDHEDAKILAGGHSLIPMMKLRLAQPSALIDIGRIAELSGVSVTGQAIRIGALTTHNEITRSSDVQNSWQVLAEAAGKIADPVVRNKGTIGGNIAHADPASDIPAVVVALNGVIHALGPDGERTVGARDFFQDLFTTDLRESEIISAIELPAPGARTGSAYLKFEHPASGFAVCGAAAVITLDGNGNCSHAGLCFNGITAAPLNAETVTAGLVGSIPGDDAIDRAVGDRLTIEDPLGDTFASGPYRIALAKVFAARALKSARDRAAG